jgi:hypothetical protein
MVIVSGNTRILFDGQYGIVKKIRSETGEKYKMVTFNKEEDIKAKPDEKYVKFAPNFFPGALISARILIKFENTTEVV